MTRLRQEVGLLFGFYLFITVNRHFALLTMYQHIDDATNGI